MNFFLSYQATNKSYTANPSDWPNIAVKERRELDFKISEYFGLLTSISLTVHRVLILMESA